MNEPKCCVVLPAAGVGRRMAADLPKQYLELAGRLVIEHTLERMLSHPQVDRVVVAIGKDDNHWAQVAFAQHPKVSQVTGGTHRSDSVINALAFLSKRSDPDDWVLVHDAARPCVRLDDITQLLRNGRGHPVGGLLGVPVHDTMKRTDARGEIIATVDRQCLWHAFTPQMFRLGQLLAALKSAKTAGQAVTDEASAMELAGYHPLLVKGSPDNIKITRPEDLDLAAYFLRQQATEHNRRRLIG